MCSIQDVQIYKEFTSFEPIFKRLLEQNKNVLKAFFLALIDYIKTQNIVRSSDFNINQFIKDKRAVLKCEQQNSKDPVRADDPLLIDPLVDI